MIYGGQRNHRLWEAPVSNDRCSLHLPEFSWQDYVNTDVYDGRSFVKQEDSAFQGKGRLFEWVGWIPNGIPKDNREDLLVRQDRRCEVTFRFSMVSLGLTTALKVMRLPTQVWCIEPVLLQKQTAGGSESFLGCVRVQPLSTKVPYSD